MAGHQGMLRYAASRRPPFGNADQWKTPRGTLRVSDRLIAQETLEQPDERQIVRYVLSDFDVKKVWWTRC